MKNNEVEITTEHELNMFRMASLHNLSFRNDEHDYSTMLPELAVIAISGSAADDLCDAGNVIVDNVEFAQGNRVIVKYTIENVVTENGMSIDDVVVIVEGELFYCKPHRSTKPEVSTGYYASLPGSFRIQADKVTFQVAMHD